MDPDLLERWLLLLLAVAMSFGVILSWVIEYRGHARRLRTIPIRVHVNGIRGKSSLVRLIAGALRGGGIETIAKTTGSATRFIDSSGRDHEIHRPGAPTILEQIEILAERATPATRAMVFECMALNPDYQRVSEHRIIRATDGVILNVRRDHMEVLGETVGAIAVSLANTVPRGGHLYVGEENDEAEPVLRTAAARLGTVYRRVAGDGLTREELRPFGPFVFPENVAIALAIAERHGVARADALAGARAAPEDPGASRASEHEIEGRQVFWINLFGVNDIDSVVQNVERVGDWIGDDHGRVFILNNRADRPDRSTDFAGLLAGARRCDAVILAGELQDQVRQELVGGGVAEDRVLDFAAESPAAFATLIAETVAAIEAPSVAVFGLSNIHTEAAGMIVEHFEKVGNGAAITPPERGTGRR